MGTYMHCMPHICCIALRLDLGQISGHNSSESCILRNRVHIITKGKLLIFHQRKTSFIKIGLCRKSEMNFETMALKRFLPNFQTNKIEIILYHYFNLIVENQVEIVLGLVVSKFISLLRQSPIQMNSFPNMAEKYLYEQISHLKKCFTISSIRIVQLCLFELSRIMGKI